MTKGWSLFVCIAGTIVYAFAALFSLMATMATIMSVAGVGGAWHNEMFGYISLFGFGVFPFVALGAMIGAWVMFFRQKYKQSGYLTLVPLANMGLALLALLLMFET